jgi:hypothetical protein
MSTTIFLVGLNAPSRPVLPLLNCAQALPQPSTARAIAGRALVFMGLPFSQKVGRAVPYLDLSSLSEAGVPTYFSRAFGSLDTIKTSSSRMSSLSWRSE